MNFSQLEKLIIPEGEVTEIKIGGVVIWQSIKPLAFDDLVPTATWDGVVLDGVGYRRDVVPNSSALDAKSAFTTVGKISLPDGTVQHDIYVYGLDFSGTPYNRFCVYDVNGSQLNFTNNMADGYTSSITASVTKLADHYWKITTVAYSTKVKAFALSGVTVGDLIPKVSVDQPMFEL